ncbi:DUF3296 domain-containing protein [Salmonella enterica subsp. enterica]|nr:DUF3296 domain-containing protein [Salmonella enterica subsp. enterica serovar Minnesota]EEJ3565738.1 DUF3296 domain-containing protein [Salmonella enterica subsp. enterica]
MNHNPASPTVDDAAEGLNIQAFLQQAVDHYPRLAVFSFTALLPRSGTMTDNRALILRFHTKVWQRIGEYSWQRQQARRHSPPTILRWIWEPVGTAECKMVLLMNLNTLETVRDPSLIDSALQEMNAAISDAWWTVAGVDNNVTSMSSFIISRSDKNAFSVPFGRLKAGMDNMVPPVITARTGVICP